MAASGKKRITLASPAGCPFTMVGVSEMRNGEWELCPRGGARTLMAHALFFLLMAGRVNFTKQKAKSKTPSPLKSKELTLLTPCMESPPGSQPGILLFTQCMRAERL